MVRICENCRNKHDGQYGSGRFCSAKCARGFSTKSKRKEINEKIGVSLKKFFETEEGQKQRENKSKVIKENPGRYFFSKDKRYYLSQLNQVIKLLVFYKVQGKCTNCGRSLDVNDKRSWAAHHEDMNLSKEEYYSTRKRTLLCKPCHSAHHCREQPLRSHIKDYAIKET